MQARRPATAVCWRRARSRLPAGWRPRPTWADWQRRAAHIRERILSVTGLLPWPQRSSLRARVFGRVEGRGYSVEKVHFESLPGLFVCGNLYRPLGLNGTAPGIACPHGHWSQGRFHHDHLGSVPGRGIGLARLGCVAFTYDMVGYKRLGPIRAPPRLRPPGRRVGGGSAGAAAVEQPAGHRFPLLLERCRSPAASASPAPPAAAPRPSCSPPSTTGWPPPPR